MSGKREKGKKKMLCVNIVNILEQRISNNAIRTLIGPVKNYEIFPSFALDFPLLFPI
jgi:hypothetical protein